MSAWLFPLPPPESPFFTVRVRKVVIEYFIISVQGLDHCCPFSILKCVNSWDFYLRSFLVFIHKAQNLCETGCAEVTLRGDLEPFFFNGFILQP